VPKPPKRVKKVPPGGSHQVNSLNRGGRKPKAAGGRYEHAFAKKFGFRRVVGSGAFGHVDPTLKGDVLGEIGRLKLAFETKSWEQYDGRGKKTVSFSVALLDKIAAEAKILGREPIFVYHVKGASNEWAVLEYQWLHDLITRYEKEIMELLDPANWREEE
jgi:hypothetical protein